MLTNSTLFTNNNLMFCHKIKIQIVFVSNDIAVKSEKSWEHSVKKSVKNNNKTCKIQ